MRHDSERGSYDVIFLEFYPRYHSEACCQYCFYHFQSSEEQVLKCVFNVKVLIVTLPSMTIFECINVKEIFLTCEDKLQLVKIIHNCQRQKSKYLYLTVNCLHPVVKCYTTIRTQIHYYLNLKLIGSFQFLYQRTNRSYVFH